MRGRRRKLFIHKICIGDDNWVQGDEAIAAVACDYFQYIFTGTDSRVNEGVLQQIPRMINEEQNNRLHAVPTMDELK